jgi:hypothetical protein
MSLRPFTELDPGASPAKGNAAESKSDCAMVFLDATFYCTHACGLAFEERKIFLL